jgi:integrase/recombinase XerD
MHIPEKSPRNRIPVLNFKPAEIAKWNNGEWRIVFYLYNESKWKRFTRRVPPITNEHTRQRYAERMVVEINKKLERGNFLKENENHRLAIDLMNGFLDKIQQSVKTGESREDTYRSYKSYINIFITWLDNNNIKNISISDINQSNVIEFLEWIYYDKKVSSQTYNNYLMFMVLFFNYCKKRGFIIENPAEKIARKKTTKKQRKYIPTDIRVKIFEWVKEWNPAYLMFLYMIYYHLIRPKELSLLTIGQIDFTNSLIHISAQQSKNHKEQSVRMVDVVRDALIKHIGDAPVDYYLFSKNCKPGKDPVPPKYFSDLWLKIRKELSLPLEYKMYSLKDNGITDLLTAGVPAVKVRDHARHSDIGTTQRYVDHGNPVEKELVNTAFKKTASAGPYQPGKNR